MKILRLVLALTVVLCLFLCTSCDNEATSAESQQSESLSQSVDTFSKHGLSGIAPKQFITYTKIEETDASAKYEFSVKIETDSDAERKAYYNEILSYLKNTVKSGNVYKRSYDATFDVIAFDPYPAFEENVEENVVLECYFYLEDKPELFKLTVSDKTTSSTHVYSLALTKS